MPDRLVLSDSAFLLKSHFFEAPSHLAGRRSEVRFDPLDLTQLEIYPEGKPQGVARRVDAVGNGLPPALGNGEKWPSGILLWLQENSLWR